jgi:hypothetical protein
MRDGELQSGGNAFLDLRMAGFHPAGDLKAGNLFGERSDEKSEARKDDRAKTEGGQGNPKTLRKRGEKVVGSDDQEENGKGDGKCGPDASPKLDAADAAAQGSKAGLKFLRERGFHQKV